MALFQRLRPTPDGLHDRGNVAVIVAMLLPVFAAVVGGSVDYSRAMQARVALQDSLDSAALAVARSEAVTQAEFQAIGELMLKSNLSLNSSATLKSAVFTPRESARLVEAVASVEIDATLLGMFNNEKLVIKVTSDVARASRDLEVGLVLDITGSMAGQRIIDLKAAANELIDIVVKDQQAPFYSKIAVVPYSRAVNVGSLADSARGVETAPKTITGASRTNPVVITSPAHGFVNDARVVIQNVSGMTQLNGKEYIVSERTTNTFKLKTSNNNAVDGTDYGNYSSGGNLYCMTQGCRYLSFMNADDPSSRRVFYHTSCVSERTGTNAYTDREPSTRMFGRVYQPATDHPCPSATVLPMTSDKAALKASVSALNASGSTAGHIGVGWGWYMVSPNYAYLMPTISKPAAYATKNLVKSVVIMTDGEFNTSYCNGVISKNSTTGSGAREDKINCDSPNGHAFDQALALCTAMKAKKIVVYTVGFAVSNDQKARDFVNTCATDAAHAHMANTGADLKNVFTLIGQDISRLRITM